MDVESGTGHHPRQENVQADNGDQRPLGATLCHSVHRSGPDHNRVIHPVGKSIAVANDGEGSLAMRVRRGGETLSHLLKRLDFAVAGAHIDDVFTNEINTPTDSKRP